jgi:hypothetical protein
MADVHNSTDTSIKKYAVQKQGKNPSRDQTAPRDSNDPSECHARLDESNAVQIHRIHRQTYCWNIASGNRENEDAQASG